MIRDHYMDSYGAGQLRCRRWTPEGEPLAVVQLLHGIAEHVERYDAFAEYLNTQGFLVVAEDHMGHGRSLRHGSTRGYFHGGWNTAVADSLHLMADTRREFPHVPYVLFGHSMGSFMARTILCDHPDCGIAAAVICGTGWMDDKALKAGLGAAKLVCRLSDPKKPSALLNKLTFGSYNARVEHQRTAFDWLSRDRERVDAYIADPLCGFVASGGLMRDMVQAMAYVQSPDKLARMEKTLPVLFVAGGDDPVGGYGQGVRAAAQAFRDSGMERVDVKIYPLCRHEILNEINRAEVFRDVSGWIRQQIYGE